MSVGKIFANNVYEQNAIYETKTIDMDSGHVVLTVDDVRTMWELETRVSHDTPVSIDLPDNSQMESSEIFGRPGSGICIFVRNWSGTDVRFVLPNVAFSMQAGDLGFLTWVVDGGWHMATLSLR
jgi:hypothetical protein